MGSETVRRTTYPVRMPGQRYVSRELSHFVGERLEKDETLGPEERHERQYQLLAKILRDGALVTRDPNLG